MGILKNTINLWLTKNRETETAVNGRVTSLCADSQEETRDLKILLQSSDRQLKEERDKVKSSTSTCEQQVNILQTQVGMIHQIWWNEQVLPTQIRHEMGRSYKRLISVL